MSNVDDLLVRAAADVRSELDEAPMPPPPNPRPPQPGWYRAILTAAIVLGLGLAVFVPMSRGGRPPAVAPTATSQAVSSTATTAPPLTTTAPVLPTTLGVRLPPEGPVFGEETGVLLLIDDGIDGLTAVDLDRRLAARSGVDGQRAGDEQYSMVLVGDKLVVGWGDIHAVDVATRQSVSLGGATIFVPAAEPDRVWMVDYGQWIGDNPPQVWQVDVNGNALGEPVAPGVDGHPALGIEGGLAFEVDDGLVLWDATNQTERHIAAPQGFGIPLAVHGPDLVWCDAVCTELIVTTTTSLESATFPTPDGFDGFMFEAKFSPDGRYLAAVVGQSNDFAGGRGIWVLDRTIGTVTVVDDPESTVDFLAWSPDSRQLFGTSYSYGRSETAVWRYVVDTGTFGSVVLPFGGAMTPVVVDIGYADAYLDYPEVEPNTCQAPMGQPRSMDPCTFEY